MALWLARYRQIMHMTLARWHAMARDWHRRRAEAHAGKAAKIAMWRLGVGWRRDKR